MTVTDSTDARLVTGTGESRRQARDELRRHITIKKAMHSGLPELARGDLEFGRFGIVEHTRTREPTV